MRGNKSEGISASKQRFAGVRSEGLASVTENLASVTEGYGSGGLSGVDYNGQKYNFESKINPGRVVSTSRQFEEEQEGLSTVTEGLRLVE